MASLRELREAVDPMLADDVPPEAQVRFWETYDGHTISKLLAVAEAADRTRGHWSGGDLWTLPAKKGRALIAALDALERDE